MSCTCSVHYTVVFFFILRAVNTRTICQVFNCKVHGEYRDYSNFVKKHTVWIEIWICFIIFAFALIMNKFKVSSQSKIHCFTILMRLCFCFYSKAWSSRIVLQVRHVHGVQCGPCCSLRHVVTLHRSRCVGWNLWRTCVQCCYACGPYF